MLKNLAVTVALLCTLHTAFGRDAASDTNITIASRKEFYQFQYNKKKQAVEIKEQSTTTYLCNQFRTSINVVEFYNDQITIDDVQIDVDGRTAKSIKPMYDYYSVENTFYSDARICYFNLPLEKKGSKSEVRFEKTITDPRYFTSIYFNEGFKINTKDVVLTVPRWMKVEFKEYNFKGYSINKETRYDSKEDADIITYHITNLLARNNESSAPGPSYIYPHLLVLTKSALVDGNAFTYFNTTKEQYAWYRSLVKDLPVDESAIKTKAQEITQGKTTDIDKIKAIYYWVQDNIRYIAFEDGVAGFRPEKAHEVLRKKYGDCKGMANLTKELLKASGYDGRLCWIGTSHILYDYSTPSLAVDNHMICALMYNGKRYFLDATEKYIALDQYAERIQGRQVLIENGDAYLLEKVPATSAPQNAEYEKKSVTIKGSDLEGIVQHNWKGESKEHLLYQVNNLKKDKVTDMLQQYLAESDAKYEITNFASTDLTNWDKDLDITYSLKHKEAVSAFGNELYVDLDYRKELSNMHIDTAKRNNDFVFDYKIHLVNETDLILPANYDVQQMPAPVNIERPGYSFKTELKKMNGKLLYKKELIVKQTRLSKATFSQWNTDIDLLKKSYLEQVILVKK